MERLYVAALIKNDVLLPQCGQYLLFIDADTLFQLAVYFLVDFGYQLHGRLYALFIAMRGAGGDGLMVGYTYFVELFQVGGINRDKIDTFVEWEPVVVSFQKYPVVE